MLLNLVDSVNSRWLELPARISTMAMKHSHSVGLPWCCHIAVTVRYLSVSVVLLPTVLFANWFLLLPKIVKFSYL